MMPSLRPGLLPNLSIWFPGAPIPGHAGLGHGPTPLPGTGGTTKFRTTRLPTIRLLTMPHQHHQDPTESVVDYDTTTEQSSDVWVLDLTWDDATW